MPSPVLSFTRKKQLPFLVQEPTGPILGDFGAITPANNVTLSWNFWPQVVLIVLQMPFKAFGKTWIFTETELLPQFNPWRWSKSKKVNSFWKKIYPSGYPNQSKSRPCLLSVSNENYNYILLYLGFCCVQMVPRSKIRRSQLT